MCFLIYAISSVFVLNVYIFLIVGNKHPIVPKDEKDSLIVRIFIFIAWKLGDLILSLKIRLIM